MKGYERMERKNTRFKRHTSNMSGSDSANKGSGGPASASISTKQQIIEEKSHRSDKNKSDLNSDILSQSKTDPNYKSSKKRAFRSGSQDGGDSPGKRITKQKSSHGKNSRSPTKKPLTQKIYSGDGGDDSGSDSSSSSCLTSSVYSSTISSHLSGDED